MSPTLQQRLIGSILLFCVLGGLAFFLINNASDKTEVDEPELEQQEVPFVSSVDAIAPDKVEVVENEQEAFIDAQAPVDETKSEINLQAKPKVSSAKNDKVMPEISKLQPETKQISITKQTTISGTSWVLQLASFADKSAAQALQKKVELLGYKANIEKSTSSKGERFRIRMGPEHDKLALEVISKNLEQKLKLKPLMLIAK